MDGAELERLRKSVNAKDIANKIITLERELAEKTILEGEQERVKLEALKHLFRMLTIDDSSD